MPYHNCGLKCTYIKNSREKAEWWLCPTHGGVPETELITSDSMVIKLKEALTESVKLQSHYAKLLNMYDGGQRMQFESIEAWMDRLDEVKQELAERFKDKT